VFPWRTLKNPFLYRFILVSLYTDTYRCSSRDCITDVHGSVIVDCVLRVYNLRFPWKLIFKDVLMKEYRTIFKNQLQLSTCLLLLKSDYSYVREGAVATIGLQRRTFSKFPSCECTKELSIVSSRYSYYSAYSLVLCVCRRTSFWSLLILYAKHKASLNVP
jgi:hypothetical protein